MRTTAAALILLAPIAACSSSRAFAPRDETLALAQQRLATTAQHVRRAQPTDAERQLFMQAEGLYRYRFTFPPRGLSSYLAEGAAAITDFPALQSLAGALDLADLRLRASDGAVHLWEVLLEQYPTSTLRPLTLYRLGWAYRSVGATGLPRASGDEAFDQLAHDYPGSALAALADHARAVPWKSKATATAYSLLPGLGQLYVGEPGNGLARLAVALAAVAMVATPALVAFERRRELRWQRDWPLLGVGLGGLVVLSIDYTAAFRDALRGVVLFNERAEVEFEARHPEAP